MRGSLCVTTFEVDADIPQLVRDGILTASDGARLLEMQREVRHARERSALWRDQPLMRISIAIGAVALILGIRRNLNSYRVS